MTLAVSAAGQPAAFASSSFIGDFNTINVIASTVPKNGDVNPYGVAVVPATHQKLTQGDILVSNFNNHRNLQGTGSTIVEISPSTGNSTLFASLDPNKLPGACPGGLGLTTALVALSSGWVVVGSLPTKDGSSATMQGGCLIVINSAGQPVKTISGGLINGPWDMTAHDDASNPALFVTNVLNGTVNGSPGTVDGGTVVRIDLSLSQGMLSVGSETMIAGGLPESTDPAALVIGPTGLGLSSDGSTLYVADSLGNRIAKISDPLTAVTNSAAPPTASSNPNLMDPLGLAMAPNGDILTVNGGNGNLIETDPVSGNQVALKIIETTAAPPGPNGNGSLFGLAVPSNGSGVYYVDDAVNALNFLTS